LEREASELNAVVFSGKKDLRNLLLQYGDSSAPFQKSFPSIGVREISYDAVTDALVQTPVTIQF
jgi:NADH:ubiquinone oxidoreductase subunit C